MKWIKRGKVAEVSSGNDKVAQAVANFILKVQRGFAKFMNKGAAKLSSTTMKVAVIVFLSFGTSLSFYFMVAALVKNEPSKKVKIERIIVPRNLYKDGDLRVQRAFVITKEEYLEMKRFTDSLPESKRDSMMSARPGLMDSIKLLESIYKNKK